MKILLVFALVATAAAVTVPEHVDPVNLPQPEDLQKSDFESDAQFEDQPLEFDETYVHPLAYLSADETQDGQDFVHPLAYGSFDQVPDEAQDLDQTYVHPMAYASFDEVPEDAQNAEDTYVHPFAYTAGDEVARETQYNDQAYVHPMAY